MLIAFRVALGVCGGPLIPISQTLLINIVPKRRANAALAVWSMASILAPIAGPVIGGLIGDHWSWPWAFYIKTPLAARHRLGRLEDSDAVRNADRQGDGRFRRARASGRLGGRAADHARRRPGQGLVQFAIRRRAADRHAGRARRFRHLGNDRSKTDRRSERLRQSRVLGVDGGDRHGVRRHVRLYRAGAAVAADQHGLHRDLGGLQLRFQPASR